MSGRRGRKKAPAKQQQLSAGADDDVLDPDSTFKPIAPAAPASPIVTLATHAISPLVAAARVVSSVAAAALPTIPETQAAVAAQALDIDHGRQLATTPRSLTSSPTSSPTAVHNPFTAPATLKQTRSRTVGFGITTTVVQEQEERDEDDLQQHPGQQRDQDLQPDDTDLKHSSKPGLVSITSFLAAYGTHILYTLLLLSLLALILQQNSALSAQQHSILQQQEQVTAQAAALESLQQQLQLAKQQLQELPDQQQLGMVAATCSAGLSEINATQTLLNSTMEHLETVSEQLAANITAVAMSTKAGQQAWDFLSAAAAHQPTPSPAAAAGEQQATAELSKSSAASIAGSRLQHVLLLQSDQQQQLINQHLHESKLLLDSLPSKVQQEVQQQLAAKLPPLDVALADCGARVLFHTAISTSRFMQDAFAAGDWAYPAATEPYSSNSSTITTPASSQPNDAAAHQQGKSSDASAAAAAGNTQSLAPYSLLHKLHAFVATKLQGLLQIHPPADATAASSSRAGWQQLVQQRLMSLEHISSLLLTPAGQAAGRCLPLTLQDGQPAVLEIALPQMMEVHSVTLHYPRPPSLLNHPEEATAWFNRAPAHITLALMNSSSCSTAAAGIGISTASKFPDLCSMAGINSYRVSSRNHASNISSAGGAEDLQEVSEAPSDLAREPPDLAGTPTAATSVADSTLTTLLPDGVVSVQKEVQLNADSYATSNGRALIQVAKSPSAATGDGVGHGVFADRLVIRLSRTLGGGDDGLCLQRISAQGVPSDVAAFC